jgi:hypothetical protein
MKMKYMKYVLPLLVVVVLLIIALPAAAQGPVSVWTNGGRLPVFVRAAGTNEDPFGGFCKSYFGALSADQKGGGGQFSGAPANFGLNPFGRCDEGGGIPNFASGDGTSIRKAVYVGGAWSTSNYSVNRNASNLTLGLQSGETGYELPTCATLKSPAGTSRWFKTDTWKNKKLQVWLDDELNTATAPSGSAVFGAADNYMFGTAAGDAWSANAFFDSPNWSSYNEGYVMAIYDPDNLKANNAYVAPNAAILTVNVSGTGSPRRFGNGSYAGVSIAGGGFGGIHGYGQWNPNQPSHMLWYESVFDGWTYIRVYNQQIWDGVVSVCTYRATRDAPGIN